MSLKVFVVMAGAGACGKTTTTHAFVQGDPKEFRANKMVTSTKGVAEKKVVWTLYDNCTAAGNHKSGTDSNTGPGLVYAAAMECAKVSDIIIIDGMVSSPQWVNPCNDISKDCDVHVLLIHFELTAEEVLRRLANRRGVTPESIYESMHGKCKQLVRRAELLVEHFHSKLWDCIPIMYLVLDENDSTDDIVVAMDEALEDIFQLYGEDYYG